MTQIRILIKLRFPVKPNLFAQLTPSKPPLSLFTPFFLSTLACPQTRRGLKSREYMFFPLQVVTFYGTCIHHQPPLPNSTPPEPAQTDRGGDAQDRSLNR